MLSGIVQEQQRNTAVDQRRRQDRIHRWPCLGSLNQPSYPFPALVDAPFLPLHIVPYSPALTQRLLTLVSVWGCSFPSTISDPSSARPCIPSASLYCSCLCSDDPRLLMLMSVWGCCLPSTSHILLELVDALLLTLSGSSYFPCPFSTAPRLSMLVSVSRCSRLSTSFCIFTPRRCIVSASLYFPCLDSAVPIRLTVVSV